MVHDHDHCPSCVDAALHIIIQCLLDAISSEQRVGFIEHINLIRFTFLHSAYQLNRGRKQADAGLRCSASPVPSVILEVGSSEILIQLQTDAKLWIEDLPEVCQFLPLFPLLPPLTVTLLGKTSHPCFDRPSHCPPPDPSSDNRSIMARIPPQPSCTFASSSAKRTSDGIA